jgi:hypothetical protein
VLVIALIVVCIQLSDHRPTPTDAEMTQHFKLNETLFEELRIMIENDTLSHFPLFAQEERDNIFLSISIERGLEYESLMRKLQIIQFLNANPFTTPSENSILFYYFSKGDATWGIDKGFEYVTSRAKEGGKEFAEKELRDLVREKQDNCNLYKKINGNWNLFIFYDR